MASSVRRGGIKHRDLQSNLLRNSQHRQVNSQVNSMIQQSFYILSKYLILLNIQYQCSAFKQRKWMIMSRTSWTIFSCEHMETWCKVMTVSSLTQSLSLKNSIHFWDLQMNDDESKKWLIIICLTQKKKSCSKWEPEPCFHSITWEAPASWIKYCWQQVDQRDFCHFCRFTLHPNFNRNQCNNTAAFLHKFSDLPNQSGKCPQHACLQDVNFIYAKWKCKLYPLGKSLSFIKCNKLLAV